MSNDSFLFQCVDLNGDELKLTKIECLSKNATWANSKFNFDNSGQGFLNMVFLVSRMGWVSIINDGSDAVGHVSFTFKFTNSYIMKHV